MKTADKASIQLEATITKVGLEETERNKVLFSSNLYGSVELDFLKS
jgi:hypothetical protein